MLRQDSNFIIVLFVVVMLGVGCTSAKRQVRTGSQRALAPQAQQTPAPKPAQAVTMGQKPSEVTPTKPAQPLDTFPPAIRQSLTPLALLQTFGQRVLAQGERFRKRAQWLHKTCNGRRGPKRICKVYWRAQRVFAINYRTKRSNYRGYMMLRSRYKRRIPRYLMRWYKKTSQAKYEGPKGRCYIDQGNSSSCMGFAMCAVRQAMRDFTGPWGKGFVFPAWGYVNYWANQAYYQVYHDYRHRRRRRRGIRWFLRNRHRMQADKRRRKARQLLGDMHAAFMRIVRRKQRHTSVRRMYQKLFCTTIVAGITRFSHAQPGDLFAIAYAQKRGRRRRVSSIRFRHWGIVADPTTRTVLHNQTPGGQYRRQFTRWGIQYGTYSSTFTKGKWKWQRRRKLYEKRVVFFNRLNPHFYIYARQHSVPIYRPKRPSLCKEWIARYGEVYFTHPNPNRSTQGPQLLSLR